ncbi:hypothetical protein FOPG_02833 [Fusarium oxysporum f. sp. conglutinans race 2 54008]|uniref:Uncharacterized protein n=2 Tax=Fusarium oxysporum TaxID=5507 RepID=X0NJT0_FUSOX|nr:hypothetical protein FOPG_02833 [Fusarium oxysporum f. sp. conglutinans race 2 54008]EXM32820.1 hypothetical protein FOTG_03026 [Fusarium oxysporum f. sp. vasinfectum 25433]KAI8403257.1 hypothetical protein FOFC_16694 [Fusarium oxysporum]
MQVDNGSVDLPRLRYAYRVHGPEERHANWRWPSPTRYIQYISRPRLSVSPYPATSAHIPEGLLIPMQTEISDNKPRPSLRYMTLTHRQNKICQAICPCDKHNGSKPAFSISPSTARPRVPDAFYLPGSSIGSIGPLISISMHAMPFSFGGYVRSVTLTRSHPPPLYLPG